MRKHILLTTLVTLIVICIPLYWMDYFDFGLAVAQPAADSPQALLPPAPVDAPVAGAGPGGPVLLNTRDARYDRGSFNFGMLVREIVRQGILLAAREEMGLPTRDASLRERFPADPQARHGPLEVMAYVDRLGKATILIFRQRDKQWDLLWHESAACDPRDAYGSLLALSERWSRADFVQVLETAGFERRAAPAARDSAPVPPETARLLDELTIPAHFAALRELHEEIRVSGESPELLAALVRSYATMGILTEWLWSPAHKAFKARALLYAERAVNRWPTSADALRSRALARALIGFHGAALRDLQAAVNLPQPAAGAPPWTEPVEAFCKFDADALEQCATDDSQAPFVRLLQVLGAELDSNESRHWTATKELAKAAPKCLRAQDSAATINQLSIFRFTTAAASTVATHSLIPGLSEIPELPLDVARLVGEYEKTRQVERLAQALGIETPDEMRIRLQVIERLKAAVSDPAEPSWNVLGQLLEEVTFLHAWWKVDELVNRLCVRADEEIEQLWPQVEHHPYAQFIAAQRSDQVQKSAAALTLAETIKPTENEVRETPIHRALSQAGVGTEPTFWQVALAHHDSLPRELRFNLLRLQDSDDEGNALYAIQLGRVSPHMPLAVAAQITHLGGFTDDDLPKYEQQYAHSPAVQLALGKKYMSRQREEDALRCLNASLKLDPVLQTCYAVSEIHWNRGDEQKWLETLEEFLATEQFGLGHTRVRCKIAYYYGDRREWEKARPYAEEAANSYAADGLLAAAWCSEGLQDWDAAEKYYAAISGRYENYANEWYYFCKRTGNGDADAALQVWNESLENYRRNQQPLNWFNLGVMQSLAQDLPGATQSFREAYRQHKAVAVALRAAILLDKLGDENARDELLAQIAAEDAETQEADGRLYIELAAIIHRDLAAGGKADLDKDALDRIVAGGSTPSIQTGLAHVAASYLAQHQQEDWAVNLWKSRMSDVQFSGYSRTWAGAALCERGIKPETYKELIWKKPDKSPRAGNE